MRAPALVVLADALWKEAYPGPLHVLAGEIAREHQAIWVEAPIWECLKAPGLGSRLRRACRLDLPLDRYLDAHRELDILTPPIVPPGSWAGDVLLAQTVRWILKGRKLEPRVLWLARRGPAADALVTRLKADFVVDHHPDPAPGDAWHPQADMVVWPAEAPLPEGASPDDPRLHRLSEAGVRGALKLAPIVSDWLNGPSIVAAERRTRA